MQYDLSLGLLPSDETTWPYAQLGRKVQNASEYKQRKQRRITTIMIHTFAGSISPTPLHLLLKIDAW